MNRFEMLFSTLKSSWARKHVSCYMTDACVTQCKVSSTVTVRWALLGIPLWGGGTWKTIAGLNTGCSPQTHELELPKGNTSQ